MRSKTKEKEKKKNTNLALGGKKKKRYFIEFVSVIKSTISIHFIFKATEGTCLTKVKALLWFRKKGQKWTTSI